MLPLEKNLTEIILDLVKTDPKSISGITRDINSGGYKYHKLVITGYLKALEDMGYVRERDLPPSKVYYKSTPHKKDVYESVGEKVSEMDLTKREQILVTIYILGRLFHRPIFKQELSRCGFTGDIEAPTVEPGTISEARKILLKSGIRIPKNEPAYEAKLDLEDKFQQIVLEILVERFGIKKLIFEGTQSKLEMD
jgi:DNA-binding HxlR family transcriptional regulator